MPPVNDDFAARTILDPDLAGSVTVDNTTATLETGEPDQGGLVTRSLWFEWTCPDPGPGLTWWQALAPSPTTYAPIIAVYTAPTPTPTFADLVLLGVDRDQGGSWWGGVIEDTPTPGTTYYVQVGTTGTGGSIEVSWGRPGRSLGSGVGNDDFADRVPVSGTGSVDVDVSAYSYQEQISPTDPGEFAISSSLRRSAWWEWACPDPAPDTATFSIQGRDGYLNTEVQVLTGASFIELAAVDSNSDQTGANGLSTVVLVSPTPGTTYVIRAGVWAGSSDPPDAAGTDVVTFAWDAPGPVVEPGYGLGDEEETLYASLDTDESAPTDTVAEEDTTGVQPIMRVSETYDPPPAFNPAGRPEGWEPSGSTIEEWGHLGIQVSLPGEAYTSITRVRGLRTEILELDFQEPNGEGPGTFVVRGATVWDLGQPGFEWLAAEVNIDVVRWQEGYVRTYWSGVVQTVRPIPDGVELVAGGVLSGVLGYVAHRPKVIDKERDVGWSIVSAIRRTTGGNGRRKAFTAFDSGITTIDRGSRSESVLEYITRMVQVAQTVGGDALTIGRVIGNRRKYELRWKKRMSDAADVTVNLGGRGVAFDLQSDFEQVYRAEFGEGVSTDGCRWRNLRLPNVGKETIPAFPGTITYGDSGPYVHIWQSEIVSDGHGPTGNADAILSGTYLDLEVEACKRVQREAGLPVTGVLDSATWDATWSNGNIDMKLGGAYFAPLVYDDRIRRFDVSSNGSALAPNPGWDNRVLPLTRFVSYGQGVDKAHARRWAERELDHNADPFVYGSITLSAGGDPEEMSRLDIVEGMILRARWWGGTSAGIKLHVAGVHWSRADGGFDVRLDLSEHRVDRLTLAQIMQRNREARQDPVRMAINQYRRSAQHRDTPAVWDCEAGMGWLPDRDAAGGQWNVYKVAAGQYGSLSHVRVETSPATRLCVALFGGLHGVRPAESYLNAIMPDPFADPGDALNSLWEDPDILDGLTERLFVEAFGGFHNRGGYSPGSEYNSNTGRPTGKPVTGVLSVGASTDYVIEGEPILWLAVWPEDDTQVSGQLRLLPNE